MPSYFFLFFFLLIGCSVVEKEHKTPLSYKSIWTFKKDPSPLRPAKNVVLVGGCFDVFHYGHLTFLDKAKQQGDYLIVALESDESIQRYKNRQPIHNLKQRAALLKALKYVDEVILLPPMNGDQDYSTLVQTINPKVIAITEGDPNRLKKEQHAAHINAKIVPVTPLLLNFSSTRILQNHTKLKKQS